METYIFEPSGHGSCTFVVQASSQEEAERKITAHVNLNPNKYEYIGWGTEYYSCTVLGSSIVELPND